MSSDTIGRLAQAREIGESIEWRLGQLVEPLRLVDDETEWHDARTERAVDPTRIDVPSGTVIPVVDRDVPVEIKAARRSQGARGVSGRWYLRHRQHRRLSDAGAVYALAVYDDDGDERSIQAVAWVPATTMTDMVRDRWHDSTRDDERVAKVSWSTVLDREIVDDSGGRVS